MKTFNKLAVASALAILPISAFAQTSGSDAKAANPVATQTTAPATKTDMTAAPSGTNGVAAKNAGVATGGKTDTVPGAGKTDMSATAGKTEAPKVGAASEPANTHVGTTRKSHVKVMKIDHNATAPTGVQMKAPEAPKS